MTNRRQIEDEIHARGFCIVDNFLTDNHYKEMCTTIRSLHRDNSLKSAKIGQKTGATHAPDIRNDQIYWLDEAMPNTAVKAWFTEIDNIRIALNQAHFAVYQPGSFYKKHVDQFATNLDRRISCVYYMNEHWLPEHGGELTLYNLDDQPQINIEPCGNRLVCFNSDLPHEVSTAHHIRYSIAGWLKVRPLH